MLKRLLLLILISKPLFGFTLYYPVPWDSADPGVSIVTASTTNSTGTENTQVANNEIAVQDPVIADPFGHPPDNETNSTDPECEDKESNNSSTSSGDQDNDVPTLLSIRSRVYSLQQELTAQAIKTRGTTSVSSGDSQSSQEVSLANIYDALNNTKEKQDIKTKETELEDKEQTEQSNIESSIEDLKQTLDMTGKFNPKQAGQKMDTHFGIDIGNRSFYLDPINNTYTGGISIVSWQELADWIKIVIGVVAVIIFFTASNGFYNEIIDTITKAPKSAPVSNIAVFGNSLGTIGLKLLKWGFIAGLIVTTLAGLFTTLLEANVNIGIASSVSQVLANPEDILMGDQEGWMKFAVSLLTDVLPLVTIAGLSGFYFTQTIVVRLILLGKIAIMQAAS